MNTLQRITAGSVLAAASLLGVGCNGQPKKAEYKLSELGPLRGALNKTEMHAFYMSAFAENNDNTLSLGQAEKYVKAKIFKDPNKPTREELKEIIEVAAYVRNFGLQENLQITSRNLLAVHSQYIAKLCNNK